MLDKIFDFISDNGPWAILSALIAAGLMIEGHGLAASLILITAILLLRPLQGAMIHYGVKGLRKRNIIVGLVGGSLVAFMTSSPGNTNSPDQTPQSFMAPVEQATDQLQPDNGFVTNCRATDGDTLRCGDERIRLLGIDAPEMPGSCAVGRACVPGDPYASQASLAAAMTHEMAITRTGSDRYRRTLAMVYSAELSLSCIQLMNGQAAYVSEWDDGSLVAAECL